MSMEGTAQDWWKEIREPYRSLALVRENIRARTGEFRRHTLLAVGLVGATAAVFAWHFQADRLLDAVWQLMFLGSFAFAFGSYQVVKAFSARHQLQLLHRERRVYESAMELVKPQAIGSAVAEPTVKPQLPEQAMVIAQAKVEALEEESAKLFRVFKISMILAGIATVVWFSLVAWEFWQLGWDVSWWKWAISALPMELVILLAPAVFILGYLRLSQQLDAAREELAELEQESTPDV